MKKLLISLFLFMTVIYSQFVTPANLPYYISELYFIKTHVDSILTADSTTIYIEGIGIVDTSLIGYLNQDEKILGDWDNTDVPWAENELVSTVLVESDLNTFNELQTLVADKTLLNEEDDFTITGLYVFSDSVYIDTLEYAVGYAGKLTATGQIQAEHLKSTDDIEVANDILMSTGGVIGITGQEIITITAGSPGTINITGASFDVDGAATASSYASDGSVTATTGMDLGTSQALTGTTAMTIGDGTQTVNINSSDWAIDATGIMTNIGNITTNGTLDQTIANTGAGGDRGINLSITHDTNALTGTIVGVRGNARINIDSPAGTVMGAEFKVGNTSTGYDISIVRGVYSEVVNKIPSGATTWDYARAYEANMDLDQGSAGNVNTISNAAMFYGLYNLPTENEYSVVTKGYGFYIRNEAVGGKGQMLDAMFYGDDLNHSGGIKGWDYGLDFEGVVDGFGTADFRLGNGALFNNSSPSLLTITEATVDIEGNFTATTMASDGVVKGATYGSDGSVSDVELLYINSLSSNAQTQITDNAALVDTDDKIIAIINASPSTQIGVPAGGTGVGTFALNGILFGNTTSALGVTAIGAEGQILRAGASPFVPAWTTATFPASTTVSQLLYSSSNNVVAGLATGNSSILVTSAGGIPSLATDIPTAVTIGTKYIYRVDGTDVADADVVDDITLATSSEANFLNNAAAATFGAVGTDVDVVLAFDAVGNQGSLTYMNTEDRFDFDNDVDVIADLTANTIASDAGVSGVDADFSGDLYLNTTKKLIFADDGDDHTYILESGADVLDTYVGGVLAQKITESSTISGVLYNAWNVTGALTASNLSGTNTGDEALSTSSAGLDVSDHAVDLDVTPSAGNATLEQSQDALQVKYDATLTEGASGLGINSSGTSAFASITVSDSAFIDTLEYNVGYAGKLTATGVIQAGSITSDAGIGGVDLDLSGDIYLDATKKIIFADDGDDHTYILQSGADVMDMYIGGVLGLKMTESSTISGGLYNAWDITGASTANSYASDGSVTAASGMDLGTSQALTGTTAMTIGSGGQTVNINSSDWNIDATGIATNMGDFTSDGDVTATGGDFTGANGNAIDIGEDVDGTITFSRDDAGAIILTNVDNDANSDLTIVPGGTGNLLLGDSGGTVQIVSSDWTISTTGVQTNMGNITSNGTIQAEQLTSTDDALVEDALTLGQNTSTSGTLNWIASDNDQGTMAIGTSDNFAVSGFSGGFDINGAFTAGSMVSDADVTGNTVASITAANLVDKSAIEAIAGEYTFSDTLNLSDGTDIFSIASIGDKFVVYNDAAVQVALVNIDSIGNTGIGISNPYTKLHINGDIAFFPREQQALVSFIFDDGDTTAWTVMKPLFDDQGEVANAAINTDVVGDAGKLSSANLVTLENAGWEILSHSKTHGHLIDSTDAVVRSELSTSKSVLEGYGLTVKNYVHPYNESNETIRRIAKEFYRSARAGGDILNPQILDTYILSSYNADDHTQLTTYQDLVDSAESQVKWAIFYLHGVITADSTAMNTLVDYIQGKSISIVTVNQGLNLIGNIINIGDNFVVHEKGIRTGEILFAKGSQDYLFTDRSTSLAIQSQTSGMANNFELYSKDGDGTDNVQVSIFGVGTPSNVTNRERLQIRSVGTTQYEIFTEEGGTGTLRPIVIYTEGNTDQLRLAIDGNVGISTATPKHDLSLYSATPWIALTDTDVNINVSSAAQAIDSSSVFMEADGTPSFGMRGLDGAADAWDLTIDTNDKMLFRNASGGYDFDGNIITSGTVDGKDIATLLGATPGTATASIALIVDASKDITLDGGDLIAAEITGTSEANFTNNAAAVTFGAVGTDVDVVLAFDAVGNQGSLTYMNTEDSFVFDTDILANDTSYVMEGHSTSRNITRAFQLNILDGTNANTLDLRMSGNFNSTDIADTDNVAKGATTGDYTLSADGQTLTLDSGGIDGTLIDVIIVSIQSNESGTWYAFQVAELAGEITIKLRDINGNLTDITAVVDAGLIRGKILYFTST